MNTIKINKKDTKIIAHRGLSGIEQENTVASFFLASMKSYYGIETDIHVTKDNKFILCHDDNIKRVTGIDKVIEESTFDELRKIRVFDKDGSYKNNLRLPTLDDYIKLCKYAKKVCVLEFKNKLKEEHIKEILNIIKSYNYLNNMIFISFEIDNLRILRKLNKDVKIQYLSGIEDDKKKKEALKYALDIKTSLDVYFGNVTKEFIDECHKNNLEINVWTVDNKEKAEELISLGVDYITSNILE